MAGFLRKKAKQDPQPRSSQALSSSPPSSPNSMPPLFARFSTTAQSVQETPRVVSPPMSLARARKDSVGNSHVHHRVSTSRNPSHYPAQPQRDGEVRAQPSIRTIAKSPDTQTKQDNGPPLSRQYSPTHFRPRPTSILDKPLPPSFPSNPSNTNLPSNSFSQPRSSSPEETSPIQGEYAHLWSIIAGDSSTPPDPPEYVNTITETMPGSRKTVNQDRQELTRPDHQTSHIPGASEPPKTLVTAQIFSSRERLPEPPVDTRKPSSHERLPGLPPGAQKSKPPIGSPYSLTATSNESLSGFRNPTLTTHPSHMSLSRSSFIDPSTSHSSLGETNSWTTLSSSDTRNEGLSKEMTRTQTIKPKSSPQEFRSSLLSLPESLPASPPASPKASRKLSKAKPANYTTTRSPQTLDTNRSSYVPSAQVRNEPFQPFQNARDVMANTSSNPRASSSQDLPNRTPSQNLPRDRLDQSPGHSSSHPQQLMNVSYNPNPLRKSPSTTAPGKPLIFAAMASVNQQNSQSAAPLPPVQHVNTSFMPSQVPPPQHHPSGTISPPVRRESLHPSSPPRQTHPWSPPNIVNAPGHIPGIQSPPHVFQTSPQPVPPPKDIHPTQLNGTLPPLPAQAQPQPGRLRRPAKSRPSQTSADLSNLAHSRTSSIAHARAPTPKASPIPPGKAGPIHIDGDVLGVPLDDDPFAKVEGVRMLKPTSSSSRPSSPSPGAADGRRTQSGNKAVAGEDLFSDASNTSTPRLSVYHDAGSELQTVAPPIISGADGARDCLTGFLSEPRLLGILLEFLQFYEWCMILGLSRDIRFKVVQTSALREIVLERFLKPVGYTRWPWNEQEPLSLSLQDLNDYMQGVSTPTHEYSRVAALYVHSLSIHPSHRDQSLYDTVRQLAASTRAYTRVILRLRVQAEKEAAVARMRGGIRGGSRPSSRAPSPTFSQSNHGHMSPTKSPGTLTTFQSPLFRIKRAPLLRVFVPSPEGDWLSDKSVVECEAECKRAGVMHLMRFGDVVWDVAVGDEGNVGRLVWDGSYLIDLDYSYSPIGDLPMSMPTLAFPPSYFYRVIRAGPNSSNPIVHIDIRPWGGEVAANIKLLQERVRTETPQGAQHNLVRWAHRSSFMIRPLGRGPSSRSPNQYNRAAPSPPSSRIPIPDSNQFVDPGWYGKIVVETEGTNESLADLQDRCGPGAFPPRPGINGHQNPHVRRDEHLVFRILREKSRPGEIWIRTVSPKERLL